ncbi:MATE family efflux transporter [Puniceibacterium sp. IMCC21224]|uniref:MATE family efflux transporter n=1 Tax=Puniceibacterium sp. IMCC21224 TaxID=1618204 RepID=UPI00064DBF5F|nr:MATE family efflux transporter [Puniceibacterium sp. IMCC21224]KMK67364.1 Na+-driven multidrug efflux pump [Puniceibacterium sp. IMCC21224]
MLQNTATPVATPSTNAIFQLAWPLTLKTIMLHGIIVIDAYLVAGLGEEALAAMGLAGSIGGLLLGILVAFSTATQIRVAQAFGSGQPAALKSGAYCGLVINLGVSLLGMLAVALAGGTIIDRFAHTPEIAHQAQLYLNVFMIVILGEAVGQALSSHFNGCGETKTSFYSYVIALPVNVGLSIALIHGMFGFPELGLVGAAVGSAVASLVRTVYLAERFFRSTQGFPDAPGWLYATFRHTLIRHLIFALPIAATFISATLANTVAMLIYAKLSVNQFAALTLIMPWVMVAGTLGITWAQATGILVAQLLGRNPTSGALDEFLMRAWRGAFVAAALVSATYLVVGLSSGLIYSELQSETRAALLSFVPILLVLPFPKGSNAICGNTLRAGGETVYVMNIFVGSQWFVRIPLTAIMVLYLDLSVAWVFSLLLVEELVKFPPFHLRLFKGEWKHGLS